MSQSMPPLEVEGPKEVQVFTGALSRQGMSCLADKGDPSQSRGCGKR